MARTGARNTNNNQQRRPSYPPPPTNANGPYRLRWTGTAATFRNLPPTAAATRQCPPPRSLPGPR
eukprot:8428357-Lingulodinium_polyedra.AAC.1